MLNKGPKISSATPQKKFVKPKAKSALSPLRMQTAAMFLAVLAAAGCNDTTSGSVKAGSSVVYEPSCNPMPDCPEVSFGGNLYPHYLVQSDRWVRANPTTGELVQVCDPVTEDICQEGQSPEVDGCEPEVCESAQENICDPIPSRKEGEAYRRRSVANFPTSSREWYPGYENYSDPVRNPVIFDNVPDCEEGESPEGETYYACDVIPTCPADQQIPYCEPLPRCEPGESPISCKYGEDGETPWWGAESYTFQDDCQERIYEIRDFLSRYDLGIDIASDIFCQPEYNADIDETVYKVPLVKINCLPTPECEDGETSEKVTRNIPMACDGVEWVQEEEFAASCDRIPSCDPNE